MGNSVMLNGVEYAGEQIAYKDSTYELVSKVAYLIPFFKADQLKVPLVQMQPEKVTYYMQ